MRAMSVNSLALIGMLALLTGMPCGWAAENAAASGGAATPAAAAEMGLAQPGLGDIRAFDVIGLPTATFAVERDDIPHEMVEYIRTAIQADPALNYSSPGQGVLRLKCDNNSCTTVRAEVTYGADGPVVWQKAQRLWVCRYMSFRDQPDTRKAANALVRELAADYQKAVKANPQKIQISEE